MKITNLNPKSYKQLKPESTDTNVRGQGIMRRLLEKYKPKYHCNVENIGDRKNKKRVA